MLMWLSILLLTARVVAHPTLEFLGAIEAMPPSVTLSAAPDGRSADASAVNNSPLLTNSLFQIVLEESDAKRRVQRYRDVE